MPSSNPAQTDSTQLSPQRGLLACAAICFLLLALYWNSFGVPFIFDDLLFIVENPSILHLSPLWDVVSPPHDHANQLGHVYAGRPVVNLSFAINHALGGWDVWGYHAWNWTVHVGATAVLFGVIRRTLLQPPLRSRFASHAFELSLAASLLWAVHPLQTESVTYILQRAESMAGLLYLLTLYCFIRGAEPKSHWVWFPLSVAACLIGAGTKEIIVSAPLLALFYDRQFLAGTFREAWRRRWKVYVALLATWSWLGYLALDGAFHGSYEGFNHGMDGWDYACVQLWAIPHYLGLVFWPWPLVLDYGVVRIEMFERVWPQALLLIGLGVGTLVALVRRSAIGFLGLWFFAILAPSSSILPIPTQTVAEHRIYLSLAAISTLIVVGGFAWIAPRYRVAYWIGIIGLIGGLGVATIHRNETYQTSISIWKDTLAHWPRNSRIYYTLGVSYYQAGQIDQAIALFRKTSQVDPNFALAYDSLGQLLAVTGHREEAIDAFETYLQLEPENASSQIRLGTLFIQAGRPAEAIPCFEETLRLQPDNAKARAGLEAAHALLQKQKK